MITTASTMHGYRSLPCILLVALVLMPFINAATNFMQMITNSAAFPLRQEAGATVITKPFTFLPSATSQSPTTWPAGTIAIYGGNNNFNDVVSAKRIEGEDYDNTDNAHSFQLLAGSAMMVNSAYTSLPIVDASRSADCEGPDGTVYLVGGRPNGNPTSSNVAYSDDLKSWTSIRSQAFTPRARASCVVDKNNNVYLFAGNTLTTISHWSGNVNTTISSNDIWRGQRGTNWQRITQNVNNRKPGWSNREGQDTKIITVPGIDSEIIILANGFLARTPVICNGSAYQNNADQPRYNDIWVTEDYGVNWIVLNEATPYPARMDSEITIHDNGIMVISAGDCQEQCDLNDVWASLDGGYTWGACCTSCGFLPREDHVAFFDKSGYYVIMSGGQDNPSPPRFGSYGDANDVWRSSVSFNNPQDVANACGLTVPTCGTGLKCFPGGYCPCSPAPGVGTNGLQMSFVGNGPFSRRFEGGLALRTQTLTFVGVDQQQTTWTTPHLVLYGGRLNYNGASTINDVWASSDHGQSWSLISGCAGTNCAGSTRTLRDVGRSADCSDDNGRLYLIGGDTGSQNVNTVWASDDGVNWDQLANAPFWGRQAAMCTIDRDGNILVTGGMTAAPIGRLNDVWRSTDKGRSWVAMTLQAAWPMRYQHDATSFYQRRWAKTVFYILNGITNNPFYNRANDIWASSDEGRSWSLICSAPPYYPRQDSETLTTQNGAMIMLGGDSGQNYPGNHNDIVSYYLHWASLDGGYTWGRCNYSAGFLPREDHAVELDERGYLVLATGEQPGIYQNDVWISTTSLNDNNVVARLCSLSVPSSGVGLTCWPCAAGCPCNTVLYPWAVDSSSSSPSGPTPLSVSDGTSSVGLVIGMIILGWAIGMICAVALIYFCGWSSHLSRNGAQSVHTSANGMNSYRESLISDKDNNSL